LKPIEIKGSPHLSLDHAGKKRWSVLTKDGVHMLQARWMMMNYLHAINLPKIFHVHHINGKTDDDRIENLQLKRNGLHITEHRKYKGRFGISRLDDSRKYDSVLAIERNADPKKREKHLARKKELHRINAEKEKEYRIKYRKEHISELLVKEAARRKILSQNPQWREENRVRAREWRKKIKNDPEAMERKRLYDKLAMRKYRAKKKEEQRQLCAL